MRNKDGMGTQETKVK